MTELSPGQALGQRFLLVRRIAEGGTAEVWLAEDRELGRRVALKFLDPAALATAGARARLEQEIQAASVLPAGQVVEVLGLHEADGRLALEMEYLPGGDLGQFRGRPFSVYARLLDEVAEALARAHARGLVHRDLKCANVLLDAGGRARLADFGLATPSGTVVAGGSPYNRSPQQLRGEPAGPADDLYAFGAMLYELLSGYPPFYPDITRERVLHDPVPPLVPRAPAPDRVRQLALRLLAKAPESRPASMGEVRRELAQALAEPVDQPLEKPRPAPPAAPPVTRRGPRAWILVAAVAALVAGLAFVFVWLPRHVADRPPATVAAQAGSAADGGERERAAQEAAARERARVAAGQVREEFSRRIAAVEKQGAASWATADLARARSQAEDAGRLDDQQDFTAAKQAWEAGLATVGRIEAARPAALAAALAAGQDALLHGRADDASRQFQLALSLQPDSAAARQGLARAGRIDQVFALLDAADRDRRAGRLDAAAAGYRKALALDADAPGAREALGQVTRRQAEDSYAALMSRGMAAMAAGRGAEAQSAFEQAGRIRPGSAEVRDALAELARSEKAAHLQALTARALAAEHDEQWETARAAWSDALAIEPTLIEARQGLDRVVPRLQLDARIDKLLGDPSRLWTPAVRVEARGLIAQAATVPAPRAHLAARAARLDAEVKAAETPVMLRLQSDGATDVVVYRVGDLGAFDRKDVELLPGRYTVVGTRPGYRDVRIDVEVRPGRAPDPVVVRCEEAI